MTKGLLFYILNVGSWSYPILKKEIVLIKVV